MTWAHPWALSQPEIKNPHQYLRFSRMASSSLPPLFMFVGVLCFYTLTLSYPAIIPMSPHLLGWRLLWLHGFMPGLPCSNISRASCPGIVQTRSEGQSQESGGPSENKRHKCVFPQETGMLENHAAGVMTQWFRAGCCSRGLTYSAHVMAHNCGARSRGPDALF